MSEIVVVNSLTLDGVMQGPGRPDEDTRGGFEHGGWAQPYTDAVLGQHMAEGMTTAGPILLGRRTYEDFAAVWPHMPADNPYTEVINNATKYVASTTLKEPLAWNNSTLLDGEATDAVAALREPAGPDIVVLGSGELVRSLARAGLVDRYVLLIHPLVLGSGRRLFDADGTLVPLRLVDSVTTTTGVIIATYQPAVATTG
ncbi:MAG TPA: dihydrofolate reductase family protein [Jiangellaceae bacterium]